MLPRHVYVHVPFCARRCSYCDFAIAVRRIVPVDEFIETVRRELALRFPSQAPWPVETLYLGGGTPSLLGLDGVARLLDVLRARIDLDSGAEVTIEANPDDVTAESAARWVAADVNRLSIGVQSFDARALAWMHRTHHAEQSRRAAELARAAGVASLSLDLIFALPTSLGRDWDRDLESAVALRPDHLSLYGLTVESGTPLARWRDRGAVHEAPEDAYEREFLRADERLAAAGFEHYEVSNFARVGARARHNSSYWRNVPYVGLGPSAHEFDGARRRWNARGYTEWRRLVSQGCDPVAGEEVLTHEERAMERTYLGLRTIDGLAMDGVESASRSRIECWAEQGWARVVDSRVQLTPLGWLRLDAIAADLTLVSSRP